MRTRHFQFSVVSVLAMGAALAACSGASGASVVTGDGDAGGKVDSSQAGGRDGSAPFDVTTFDAVLPHVDAGHDAGRTHDATTEAATPDAAIDACLTADPLDDYGFDSNCDGAEGVAANGIYVDGENGVDVQDGSPVFPVKTLSAALAIYAAQNGRNTVYLAALSSLAQPPQYDSTDLGTLLSNGCTVVGGLDPSQQWSRPKGKMTPPSDSTLMGPPSGVRITNSSAQLWYVALTNGPSAAATDAGLPVDAGDAGLAGDAGNPLVAPGDTFGAILTTSPSFTFRYVTIIASSGSNGTIPGANGETGAPGTPGTSATYPSNSFIGIPGQGGKDSDAGAVPAGGVGGNGGAVTQASGNATGAMGTAGEDPINAGVDAGAAGGAGAIITLGPGSTPPQSGAVGPTGALGKAAASPPWSWSFGGSVAGTIEYEASPATAGAFGGAGGGGGGAVYTPSFSPCTGGAGAGGGGGAGGAGGMPGTSGQRGGFSMALVVDEGPLGATFPSFTGVTLVAGGAGNGSAGGAGGAGGIHGAGGAGNGPADAVCYAGNGGNGGEGGQGGGGAGGPGGWSIALFFPGAKTDAGAPSGVTFSSSMSISTGGEGGGPNGPSGPAGQSPAYYRQ